MQIPIPAGYEMPDVPEGESITLPVTFIVSEGMLTPVELDGTPLDSEEEGEMEEQEAPENEDFVSSVNRQLA